jgi:hemerythrin
MHTHPAVETAPALGAALRHTRKQLFQQIDRLAAEDDAPFAAGWDGVVAAAEAAFRHEETIMELAHYTGLAAHRAENARTLGALHHVTSLVDAGDTAAGRAALAALGAIVTTHRYGIGMAAVDLLLHGHRHKPCSA